ncbi:MAG TPA: hypothetical protein VKA84_12005 [Gemmatimonadaceae bacterium]|nr:hypothetical protein [Gemmatimonadaceae bacterium]
MRRPASRVLLLALLLAGTPCLAQGMRLTGVTVARYAALRPFVDDSVSAALAVAPFGLYRRTAEGTVVRCTPSQPFCYFQRQTDRVLATAPLTQDLEAVAWGLGEGVSAHAHVRARSTLGGERGLWPRAGDRFDVLDAYAELDRPRLRARAGRLWTASGLGVYNFDGASLLVRPRQSLSGELFGGWALARGLSERRTDAEIGAVDELAPDDPGYVMGAELRARPARRAAVAARYQREIRRDRAGLFSERASADAVVRLGRASSVDGEVVHNLASGQVEEARLRGRYRRWERVGVSAELRRHRPFFELWTIWGAFSPVAFDEARADATWEGPLLAGGASLDVRAGYRRYGEPAAGLAGSPMHDDGWRVGAGATWRARAGWTVYGAYDLEAGFGASRSDGDAGVRRELGRDAFLGARATAFQTVYEFRLGRSRVVGAGLEGGLRLPGDVRLVGDATLYRHRLRNADLAVPDWSQTRATVSLEWTVGWGVE